MRPLPALSVHAGRLHLGGRANQKALLAFLTQALAGNTDKCSSNTIVCLPPSSSGRTSLLIAPLVGRPSPRAVVFVQGPSAKLRVNQDTIADLFGLTRAEAAVAVLLAEGRNLRRWFARR